MQLQVQSSTSPNTNEETTDDSFAAGWGSGFQSHSQPKTSTPTSQTPRRSPRLAAKRNRNDTGQQKQSKRQLVDDTHNESRLFNRITSRLPEHLTYRFFKEGPSLFLEISRKEPDIREEDGGPMAGGRIVSDTGAAFFQALGCEKES